MSQPMSKLLGIESFTQQGWVMKLTYIVIFLWVINIFLALQAPENILDNSFLLNNYVELIGKFFPINQYASMSNFPQVSMLINSLIWPFSPVYFVLSWQFWLAQKSGGLAERLRKPIAKFKFSDYLFLIFFAIPLLLGLGLAALFIWNGGDTRLFSTGSSRLQLGIFGFLVPLFASCCFAGAAMSIKKIMYRKN